MKSTSFLIALLVVTFIDLSQQIEFPYVARICKDSASLRCSGILVSRNLVLTSGFCVHNTTEVRVYLAGKKDFCSKKYINYKQTIKSKKFIMAKDFHKTKDPNVFSNDLALILLPIPVHLTSSRKVAKLSKLKLEDVVGKKAYVSGWGSRTSMQYNTTVVLPQATCQEIFKEAFNRSQHGCSRVDDKHKMDFIDSGSPLEYDDAIIGFKINDPLLLSNNFTFINVNKYLPFINKVINSHPVPDSGIHLALNVYSFTFVQLSSFLILKLINF